MYTNEDPHNLLGLKSVKSDYSSKNKIEPRSLSYCRVKVVKSLANLADAANSDSSNLASGKDRVNINNQAIK